MLNENKENGNLETKEEEFIECGIIEPRIHKKNNIIDISNNISIAKTNDSFFKKSKDSKIDLMESNDIQIKKIKKNYITHSNTQKNKKIFDSLFSSNNCVIKNNDLKLVLFNKDFLFREEFNDFNFNIETAILFKSPNNKKCKKYHFSIKNQVLLMNSFSASKFQIFTKLVLPSNFENIISSLKIN